MLRLLKMRKRLTDSRSELDELLKRDAELLEAENELASKIESSTPEMEAELDADIDALDESKRQNAEAKERLEEIIAGLEKDIADEESKTERAKIAEADTNTKPIITREGKSMETREREYVEAFAEYIKTGKSAKVMDMAREMRDDPVWKGLLTENAVDAGQVPVPTFVYEIIKTAWEREELVSLARKAFLKGNIKVGFEASATDADWHLEGGEDIDEEVLGIGVVDIIAKSAKKFITISDELRDMGGEAFLRYIYDEIAHRIAKLVSDSIVDAILDAPTSSTTSAVGEAEVSADPALDTIVQALGALSDEATDPVAIMNKKTWAHFMGIQLGANYAQDIFMGCRVVINNTLPDYDNVAGDAYMIVGDVGEGILLNFPNGYDGVTFKFDDLSLAEKDLIKIVGRMYVGIGVVAVNAFCRVKPAGE